MKKIIYLTLFFTMAAFTLASPVNISLDSNMYFWSYVYQCTDATCQNMNFHANDYGLSNSYSIQTPSSGMNYYAEYDFTACYLPHSYIVTTDKNTGQGPWSYDVDFAKGENCSSQINYLTLPNRVMIEQAVYLNITLDANTNSVSTFHLDGPQTIPLPLIDFYSQNVTVYLYDDGGLYDRQIVRIPFNQNRTVQFRYVPQSVGNHTLEVIIDVVDECSCISSLQDSASNIIEVWSNQTYNHTNFTNQTNTTFFEQDFILENISVTSGIQEGDVADLSAVYSYVVNTNILAPTYHSAPINFYIDGNILLSSYVSGNQNFTDQVSTLWLATNGTHLFEVMIDPMFIVNETNKSNNNISLLFFVPLKPINNTNQTNTTNVLPVSSFTYQLLDNYAPMNVQFTDLSYDVNGSISGYYWDFGDRFWSLAQNPLHAYVNAGDYVAALTVFDNQGSSSTSYKTIIVYPKPTEIVTEPEEIKGISIKSIKIYGADSALFEARTKTEIVADLLIENYGNVDFHDIRVYFSIPELGYTINQDIDYLPKNSKIQQRLYLKAPSFPGLYDAKVKVVAGTIKMSKYRLIEVYE